MESWYCMISGRVGHVKGSRCLAGTSEGPCWLTGPFLFGQRQCTHGFLRGSKACKERKATSMALGYCSKQDTTGRCLAFSTFAEGKLVDWYKLST